MRSYCLLELTFEDDDLEERHKMVYEQLIKALDYQGKVNKQVRNALIVIPQSTVSTVSQSSVPVVPTTQSTIPRQSVTSKLQSDSLLYSEKIYSKKTHDRKIHLKNHGRKSGGFHKLDFLSSKTKVNYSAKSNYFSILAIAFGKADWEKYFGDIGVEPPLPANIEEILNALCSFWPDKKVKEAVEENSFQIQWILITRDVIPGSRNKSYLEQCNMIASHSQKTGLTYEIPYVLEAASSILMHYVKTRERLYIDDKRVKKFTFTRCKECIKEWPFVVGCLASRGLHASYFCGNGPGSGCGVGGILKF